ncbi:MAG TPA: RNA-binding protein [Thermoplasmatales archaeon]|nr:RNA-binding protein [Thermoplasmata archaeon]HDH81476.1 RNA-binding protein [Thermoplasmatales archaeon]
MKNLDEVSSKIEKMLNEKDNLREFALKKCRDIIRTSRKCIRNIHNGEMDVAIEMAAEAIKINRDLKEKIKEHPDLLTSGYMENASQELAEANIFLAICKDEGLPSPEDIGVTYTSYLLGLGDVMGELRRMGINFMKNGKVDDVEMVLNQMEDICDKLMEFDYPSGLVPVKRKQDVAKKLLEQMRGDFVIFKKNKDFEEKIELLLKSVKKKDKKKKENDFGLDVDSVWR